MPKRKPRTKRNKSRFNNKDSVVTDTVMLRLITGATTSITLANLTFTDRRRPFRIVSLKYEITADQKPLVVNIRFYGPQSNADSTTTSGAFLVEGIPRRGFVQNRTKLFYPSGSANNTELLAFDAICPSKQYDAEGTAIAHIWP